MLVGSLGMKRQVVAQPAVRVDGPLAMCSVRPGADCTCCAVVDLYWRSSLFGILSTTMSFSPECGDAFADAASIKYDGLIGAVPAFSKGGRTKGPAVIAFLDPRMVGRVRPKKGRAIKMVGPVDWKGAMELLV